MNPHRLRDVTSPEDIERISDGDAVFVFLYAAWSGPAVMARRHVEVLLTWLDQRVPDPPPCYVIDCTDGCGVVWDATLKWLKVSRPAASLLQQDAEGLMDSGAGPLLWVRHRLVVDEHFVHREFGIKEFLQRTQMAFPHVEVRTS